MTKKADNFENNLVELENIVDKLESGNTSLDECIKLYEQGIELSSKCVKFLEDAQQKIKIISETNDIKED